MVAVGGGAIVGGVVGSKVGEAIGHTVAQRRRQYASEHEFLESEIRATGAAIAIREEKLAAMDHENRQRKDDIAQLEVSTQDRKKVSKSAKKLLAWVEKRIAENKILLDDYQGALEYLDQTLNTSTLSLEAMANEERTAQWEKKKTALTEKRGELALQYSQLQGVGESLEQDKARLSELVAKK